MATKQQPLRFEISDDDEETLEAAPEWGDDGEEEDGVEWGDDDEEGEEAWQAGEDDDGEEEEALEWETSTHRLDDDVRNDAADDDEEELEVEPRASSRARAAATANRRMVGPAVLSIGACLALVWAANHVPGPAEDVHHGRDAELFAKPLTTSPEDILRLASTTEAADADAQVALWRQLPAEERERGARRAAMLEARAAALAAEKTAEAAAAPAAAAVKPAVAKEGEAVGRAPAVVAASTPAAKAAASSPRGDVVVSARNPKGAVAQSVRTASASSRKAPTPVFTVQLGAFKARRNAEDLATRVRGKPTRILQEGGLYRVMSGSFSTRQDAALHEASLKKAGYTTFVRTATF